MVWYIFIDLAHTIIANQMLAEPHLLNPIEPIYLVKKNCLCLSWRGYSALVYSKEGSSLEEVNSLSWNAGTILKGFYLCEAVRLAY